MDTDNLQRNFEGYLNTPLLWKNTEVYGLEQCVLEDLTVVNFTENVAANLRLGKLVERFVYHQILQDPSLGILAENIQIIDDKRTLGEMDALLMTKNGPVHLEIVYKFYLYDSDYGDDELSHWIGPNRKDSLLQKLDKLKNKQLPLLYRPQTQLVLDDLQLNSKNIKQQVLFKAQLFLPMDYQKEIFFTLNPDAVKGFYIKKDDLSRFNAFQFYIPEKIDWLMEVNKDVNWLDYDEFLTDVTRWLDKEMAPLCWLNEDGIFRKFFVVWW